jgi:hypothetical protein
MNFLTCTSTLFIFGYICRLKPTSTLILIDKKMCVNKCVVITLLKEYAIATQFHMLLFCQKKNVNCFLGLNMFLVRIK